MLYLLRYLLFLVLFVSWCRSKFSSGIIFLLPGELVMQLCWWFSLSDNIWKSLYFTYIYYYLFIFRERVRKGKKEGEKHRCTRKTSVGFRLHTPNRGPGPQSRCGPWPGTELVPFWSVGWHPTHTSLGSPLFLFFYYLWFITYYSIISFIFKLNFYWGNIG